MTGTDEPLAAWRRQIFFRLMYLADVALDGEDVNLDFGADSLRALGRVLVDRFGAGSALPEWSFVEAAATYVGESLLRLAGGSWGWADDRDGGAPIVRADPALGLAPAAPVALVMAAAGDGGRLAAQYEEWRRAVSARETARPGWHPVKEPTNADAPSSDSAHLRGWLAERRAAFPGWARRYPEVRWDFSPESLDALETVLRREVRSPEALHDPAARAFRDGAAWYLGEVLRLGLGGEWCYDDRLAADETFEYVDGVGPTESESIPAVWLEIALTEPGALRAHYLDFSS